MEYGVNASGLSAFDPVERHIVPLSYPKTLLEFYFVTIPLEITWIQVKKMLMRAGEEELIQSNASSCWSLVKDSHWWSYGWRISVANREGVCSWGCGWLVPFDVYCPSIQAFEQTFAISQGRWKNANNRVGGIRGLGKSNACIWKYF